MKKQRFPPGWNEARVRRILDCYEHQTEAEAVAEDEAAFHGRKQSMVAVPRTLVPRVRRLIAEYTCRRRTG